MRNGTVIVFLAAFLACGCGGVKRPAWMSGQKDVPITPPNSAVELPPEPASQPAPQPLTAPPAPDSAAAGGRNSSLTLTQASPDLVGESQGGVAQPDQPLSLTDLDSLGGDLPWAKAGGDTISSQLDQGRKEEVARQPILAPLPEAQEFSNREDRQESEEPKPQPAEPPPAPRGDGSTDSVRTSLAEAKAEQPNFEEQKAEEAPAEEPASQPDVDVQPEDAIALLAHEDKPLVVGREEVVAGTTLQVNDQHVTVDDIIAGLHGDLVKIPKHVSVERFQEMAAKIIQEEMYYQAKQILMYTEANKLLQEELKKKVDEEMDATLREMVAEAGGLEALKVQCRREGSTLDEMLKAHRRAVTINFYMRAKFGPAILVTRRDLWRYYQKHKTDFIVEREVQMQIIAAPYSRFLREGVRNPTDEEIEAAKVLAKETIDEAMRELKAGKDFGDVAKRLSRGLRADKGGIWPMMPAGNFRNSRVEKEAFTLPEGKYSGVIEGQDGYYIVKALKVKPGKVTPFEEAQEDIENLLKDEQYKKLTREYVDKIFENAVVAVPKEFLPLAVQRAVERYKLHQ